MYGMVEENQNLKWRQMVDQNDRDFGHGTKRK